MSSAHCMAPSQGWLHRLYDRPTAERQRVEGVMPGQVAAVSRNEVYSFSKPNRDSITLLTGLGVEGDVHAGETIRHQFRMTYEPDLPNLRQVHLMHEELFDELALKGFKVSAGQLGENITTRGVTCWACPPALCSISGSRRCSR
jgi:Uncharacterized protein conserved in bacteria